MIKNYKIFFAWLTTVIFGSISLPILTIFYRLVFDNVNEFNSFVIDDDFFLISFLCMLISGLLSLPTIITLLITNTILTKKLFPLKKHFKKIAFTHIIMILLTILVFIVSVFISQFDLEEYNTRKQQGFEGDISHIIEASLKSSLIIVWYAICAFVCWMLFFKKEIKAIRATTKIEKENTEVIDM